MCDRTGKSVACTLASVFMNGVCCSWQIHAEAYEQTHRDEADAGPPVFCHRTHSSGTQKSQFTFHDEDWDLDRTASTLQDERRRSVMLAKMGALSGDQLHLYQVASDERDNTTGFILASPASNSFSRSVCSERCQHSRHGSSACRTRAAPWYGARPKMATTPVSHGSLIDLDEDEESEVELVDQTSMVDVPF